MGKEKAIETPVVDNFSGVEEKGNGRRAVISICGQIR